MPDQSKANSNNAAIVRRLRGRPRRMLWLLAARPKTLSLSMSPVFFGTFLAARAGSWRLDVLITALLAAVAIQVGTNLWNDASDAQRGVDGPNRLGPPRMTALGLLAASDVRCAATLAFGVAGVLGLYLSWIGGWPIVAIGSASLAMGFFYSMGPRPLSATALGEVLVICFFGIVAVSGTVYLHEQEVSFAVILMGILTGLPAAAVLLLNNHRDRLSDALAGRRTSAIRLGAARSKGLFAALLAVSLAIAVAASVRCPLGFLAFLPAMLLGVGNAYAMVNLPISSKLNGLIAKTALFQIVLLAGLAGAGILCGS